MSVKVGNKWALSWVFRIKSRQYKMMIQVILQISDLVCCVYCIVLSSTYISAAITQWSDVCIDHFCSIKRCNYWLVLRGLNIGQYYKETEILADVILLRDVIIDWFCFIKTGMSKLCFRGARCTVVDTPGGWTPLLRYIFHYSLNIFRICPYVYINNIIKFNMNMLYFCHNTTVTFSVSAVNQL